MTTYVEQLRETYNTHKDSLEVSSPCFYLDQSGWDALGDKLADPFFKDLHERNLKGIKGLQVTAAEGDVSDVMKWLDNTRAELHAVRTTMPTRALKNIVCRGTAAFYVTGDEQYKDFAISGMEAAYNSDEWSCPDCGFMGLHGANLATGDLLFAMAFAIDALWNHLSAEQQEKYIGVLAEKGLGAYLLGWEKEDWWISNHYNWNPSLHGNAALAALLILNHDADLAHSVLEKAIPSMGLHIPTYLKDGGYTEGPMYQCTAMGHLSDFVIPWCNLTGDDFGLSQNDNFKDTLRLWNYLEAGDGGTFNFSNCSEIGSEYGMAQAFWWARRADMPEIHDQQLRSLRHWQDTHGLFYDVEAFWHREANQESGDIDVSGLHHFTGIDWVTYKGTEADKAFWFAFAGGLFGGGHCNSHQGHFILGKGTQRFLCDPGYGAIDSDQHNTVSIGGNVQGNTFLPITRVEECAGGFYICIDMQPGWVSKLEHFKRHVLVLNEQDILVFDDIEGINILLSDGSYEHYSSSAGWNWQSRCPYTIDGKNITLKGEKDNLKISVLGNIEVINEKEWIHDGPLTTFSYRDFANQHRSMMPTFLTFADTVCEETVGEDKRVFSIAGVDYVFNDVNGEFVFENG
ncbi:MAG: hypothetical protein HRU15_06690 [Planctomycetes bacterium]|nr:hypothetical protein [Planctomycetota bacterium]